STPAVGLGNLDLPRYPVPLTPQELAALTTATTTAILVPALGKYKSVACACDADGCGAFVRAGAAVGFALSRGPVPGRQESGCVPCPPTRSRHRPSRCSGCNNGRP